MNCSDKIDQVAPALVAIQAALGGLVVKDKQVQAGRKSYSYTDIATLMELVNPVVAANGCAILHSQSEAGVTCTIVHASGQWLAVSAAVVPTGDAQAIGSAMTYGRRYSLQALLGLASDDDDGRAAKVATLTHEGVRANVRDAIREGHLTEDQVRAVLDSMGVEKIDQLKRDALGDLDARLRSL